MKKINQIADDTRVLRERLVEKVPARFGMRHLVSAFFGALFFGFTFVLKGLLIEVGINLSGANLLLITFATFAILSAEIFFVGYSRVPDKHKRPFGQFWRKRIIAYYGIALFVSFLLLSVYGIPEIVGSSWLTFKLVIAISLPAAVGAAMADLLGKY
ncbi:DUF2391 family protein [Candidatus Woesearchaeota archaeon]|nr:DUF2391 family protein [Candidatus Woesearchaeota archaeon]